MKKLAAMAMGLMMSAGAASAEGYSWLELGWVPNEDECARRAMQTVYEYKNRYGGGMIDPKSTSVFGWDLEPGNQDIIIICVDASGTYEALLVVHGSGTTEQRHFTRDTLEEFWDRY
jgi:hypothetical protein